MLILHSEIDEFIDTVSDPFYADVFKLIFKYKDIFSATIKSHIVFNEEKHTTAVVVALAREILFLNDRTFDSFQIRDDLLDFFKSVMDFDDWFYIEQLIDFYDEYCRMDFHDEDCYPRFLWVNYLKDTDRENRIKESMSALPYWRIFSVYCDILPNPNLAIDGNIYGYYQSNQPTRHDPYLSFCYTQKTVSPLMDCATSFNREFEQILKIAR